jgi:hypothetical protein
MTLKQIAEKHFPYNTTCFFKIQRINYQREQLIEDLIKLINENNGSGPKPIPESTSNLRA